VASPDALVGLMSQTLGLTRAACESTWKELRSKNLVINSGKGKRGTKVGPADCASFLLALGGAEHVKDSGDAVERYSNLVSDGAWPKNTPVFSAMAELGESHRLLEALTAVIATYAGAPFSNAAIALARGAATIGLHQPTVHLILLSPLPRARIEINRSYGVEYRTNDPKEMLRATPAQSEARSKRRIAASGDLQIRKQISEITFAKLGKLLRQSPEPSLRNSARVR